MATKGRSGQKYLERVLRIGGAAATAVRDALGTSATRGSIIEAIAADLGPATELPEWLVVESSPMPTVVHLATPLFSIQGHDGDEFWSEVTRPQLIYTGKGRATRIEPGQEDTATEGLAVADSDVPMLTGWATDSDVVLADLIWHEPPPTKRAKFEKLMKEAENALFEEIEQWEAPASASEDDGDDGVVSRSGPAIAWRSPRRDGSVDGQGPRTKPTLVWLRNDTQITGDEWGGYAVYGDGLVFGGYHAFLAAVDGDNGDKVWELLTTKSQSWPMGQATLADGVLYACTKEGMFALDARTGAQRWLWKASKIEGSPVILDGVAYVASKGGVTALDLAKRRKRWLFSLQQVAPAPLAYANGVLFAIADSTLFAIDTSDGTKVLWTAGVEAHGAFGPMLVGDLVIARGTRPDEYDTVVAFRQASGAVAWEHRVDGGVNRSGALAAGGGVVIVRDEKNALYAIDAVTGERRWVCPETASEVNSRGGMLVAAGVLYVVIGDLFAVSLDDGKLLWRLSARDIAGPKAIGFRPNACPALGGGTLFVSMYDGLAALR